MMPRRRTSEPADIERESLRARKFS